MNRLNELDVLLSEVLLTSKNANSEQLSGMINTVTMMADSIRASEECNYRIWGRIQNHAGDENRDIDMTFQQSIDSMKEGFRRKWQWMDNNIRNL